ncbi:DUF6207 family protein [Streptomyces sp. NBC_01237]|uniref:DUF6207 family protein n=1 Tax=Streptomyces sp. NBC_01237 TaxID=2903790 RepID=UPI002DD9A5D0|nr:DUF6207 family protein [Streptomyces sp. NBC_01237]WRZ77134.1 DUF6207 family protein [Streptomyces sp. NBC_01237]
MPYTDPINERHVKEPGLVVIDMAATHDVTALAPKACPAIDLWSMVGCFAETGLSLLACFLTVSSGFGADLVVGGTGVCLASDEDSAHVVAGSGASVL